MAAEQKKVLEALQTAIQMEIDGKQYYQKMSQDCGNRLGEKLFQSLAAEEDIHRSKFEDIYRAIQRNEAWPGTDLVPDGGKKLRTIFARTAEQKPKKVLACSTELDAVQTAIRKESQSYDFYNAQAKGSNYALEKKFYETLAAEEREHHLILLDYYEYLKSPDSWFIAKEHHSLDGG